jgi:hypothetical protein
VIANVIILLFLVLTVIVIVSLIPIYFVIMLMAGKKEAKLNRQGVTTDGEVVNWEWQKRRPITFRHQAPSSPLAGFMTYRYYADTPSQARQLFTQTENVWVAMHLKHPIGSTIRVRYLPSDPSICQIAESILDLPQDQK